MRKHCPKCKSENITLRSRRKYLLIAAACLAALLLSCLFFYAAYILDGGIGALLATGMGTILFFIALTAGLYNLIKGVFTKGTSYRCEFCNNTFEAPLLLPIVKKEDYVADIRRPLHRS